MTRPGMDYVLWIKPDTGSGRSPCWAILFIYCFMISATDSLLMFFVLQYFEFSHTINSLDPLDELQDLQQIAIFSYVIILASLIICSHDGLPLFSFVENDLLQYTQTVSLSFTAISNSIGIFQLFIEFDRPTSKMTRPGMDVIHWL
jgi:hypothetical protein